MLNHQRRDGLPEESSQLENDEASSYAQAQRLSLAPYHSHQGPATGYDQVFDGPVPNMHMPMETD